MQVSILGAPPFKILLLEPTNPCCYQSTGEAACQHANRNECTGKPARPYAQRHSRLAEDLRLGSLLWSSCLRYVLGLYWTCLMILSSLFDWTVRAHTALPR